MVTSSNVATTTATLSINILNESGLNTSSVNVVCSGGAGLTTSCVDWSAGVGKVQWPVTGLSAGTTYTCTGYNYEVGDILCAGPTKAQTTVPYEFTTLGGPTPPPTPPPAPESTVMTADTIGAIVVGIVAIVVVVRLSY